MLAKRVYHVAKRYIIIDISYIIGYIIHEVNTMSENQLVDLSFDFAKAIVSLVDKTNAPKSSYMTDQCAPLLRDFSVKSINSKPWHMIAQRQKCPVTALATGQIHIIPVLNTRFR